LINYFKSYSSLGDDRFLCHPVLSRNVALWHNEEHNSAMAY